MKLKSIFIITLTFILIINLNCSYAVNVIVNGKELEESEVSNITTNNEIETDNTQSNTIVENSNQNTSENANTIIPENNETPIESQENEEETDREQEVEENNEEELQKENNTNIENNEKSLTEESTIMALSDAEDKISSGTYIISTALDNEKVLDISGGSTESLANVQIWKNANEDQQKFIITVLSDGYCIIESYKSGKCLDVDNAKSVSGTNVQQYEKNNSSAQKWKIKSAGDGYYYIISKCGGLYLDVQNAETANGTNIQIYEGNQSKAQKFKFEKLEVVSGDQSIEDGVYTISTKLNINKVLDISGASTASFANVQIWDNVNAKQQKFKVTYLENGFYKITCINSNKSLDVNNASSKPGTNVHQYENNNSKAQQWIIKDTKDGYYNIISKCGGLYLDVYNSKISNGTNIQINSRTNSDSQKFKFTKAEEHWGTQSIENGTYVIHSALNEEKVLDISGALTTDTANVQIWDNVNVDQQRFIITYVGEGLYTIENYNSGKVLDVKNGSSANGTNVWQYTKNDSSAQKWVIKQLEDGYYSIISRCKGLYLDVDNAKTTNGTNIHIYEGNNSRAQKFKLEKLENLSGSQVLEDGMYTIATKLNLNKVLDVDKASTRSGANIQIWDKVNEKQQKFYITYLNNGFYQIKNVNSGKVLDVANGGNKSGTNVWQYDDNNSKAQQWIIKDLGQGYYRIVSKNGGLSLDISSAKDSNGTNVQIYKQNDSNAQKFRFIKSNTNGIDVSSFQGNIDWSKVKSNKIDFAIIRAGYRGYESGEIVKDTMFETNVNLATANGINCGAYFVTQAINYEEGVAEANAVLERIRECTITAPIAIDVEWAGGGEGNNGRADYISVEVRTQAIKGFCETILNAGYQPMIYANKEWLTSYIDMSRLSEYSVWLAHYVKGAPENTSNYTGKYMYWQYTSKGTCNGINGYVDLNKGY